MKKQEIPNYIDDKLMDKLFGFCDSVRQVLAEKYFADYKAPERPFSVFGHVDTGASPCIGCDSIYAYNQCGFKTILISNIYASYININQHFGCGHNISQDPQETAHLPEALRKRHEAGQKGKVLYGCTIQKTD